MVAPGTRSVELRKIGRQAVEGFEERVEEWTRAHVPEFADLSISSISVPGGSGLSGETYIVHGEAGRDPRREARLVLRKDVQEQKTNPQANFDNLVSLQTVLGDVDGLPVPKVLGVESSADVIGTPFLVMEFVDGRIPSDIPSYASEGWVRDATDEQRTRMWRSGVGFLVRLHSVNWRDHDLGGLRLAEPGDSELERCLNHAITMFRLEAEGVSTDVCEQAISWLLANRPETDDECICWGDARLGNVIWRDFDCAAAVDWEMSSLGHPGVDLGWWSFFHRWATAGHDLPDLGGMCVGQRLADLYRELGGVPIDNFPFYEILATVRGISIWLRTVKAIDPECGIADALGESTHIMQVLRGLMDEVNAGRVGRGAN